MPAFLTHWYVLIETARRSQDAGSDLGSLIIDRASLSQRLHGATPLPLPPVTPPAGAVWQTGPLPRLEYSFLPGRDISAMAFLGALAPDIPGYQPAFLSARLQGRELQPATSRSRVRDVPWHQLLHTRRSGDFLLAFLEAIAAIPSPALRSQALAFAMGYLTHIATDLALTPYLNALTSAYPRQNSKQTPFTPRGARFYTELLLDEMLATRDFGFELYHWFRSPWHNYVEPALSLMLGEGTLTTQVLDLLVSTAEATYGLQGSVLRADFAHGLHHLRRYLAGHGLFWQLTLNARLRRGREHTADPIALTLANQQREPGVTLLNDVLRYALRLSERLCRRAISYYASLRNSSASASERGQRYELLREDLRNWDLINGYTLEVSFDQEVSLRLLHNWLHFAGLWDQEQDSPPENILNLA
jgi:hypothetical protein